MKRRSRFLRGRPPVAPADIAVSEITGIPLEHLCGYVVLAARHEAVGEHTPVIVASDENLREALSLVEQAAADLRFVVEGIA